MTKWVYAFGAGKADGNAQMKDLLGGKGANLAEMSALGLPVPPGFTLTTEVCTHFNALDNAYPDDLKDQVADAAALVEPRLDLLARPCAHRLSGIWRRHRDGDLALGGVGRSTRESPDDSKDEDQEDGDEIGHGALLRRVPLG